MTCHQTLPPRRPSPGRRTDDIFTPGDLIAPHSPAPQAIAWNPAAGVFIVDWQPEAPAAPRLRLRGLILPALLLAFILLAFGLQGAHDLRADPAETIAEMVP